VESGVACLAFAVRTQPKNWQDWRDELEGKMIELAEAKFPRDTPPLTTSEIIHFLRVVDAETSKTHLEGIIRQYADHGTWRSNLTKAERYFLYRRLKYAVEILSLLIDPIPSKTGDLRQPVPEPPPSRNVLVRWLLIKAWETLGRNHWIDESVGEIS
jgi:hypothetical protein